MFDSEGASRARANKLALQTVSLAGEILKIFTKKLSTQNKGLLAELVRAGAHMDFTISGVLGATQHIRVMLVEPTGAQREMFRIELR